MCAGGAAKQPPVASRLYHTPRLRCQYPQKSTLGFVVHRQPDKSVNLEAVRFFAMILAPRSFLRETDQIRAGDIMMVAASARRTNLALLV